MFALMAPRIKGASVRRKAMEMVIPGAGLKRLQRIGVPTVIIST